MIDDFKFQNSDFENQGITELSDRPIDDGMTPEGLKARFDNIPKIVMALGKINQFFDWLKGEGASDIGATPVREGGSDKVQGILAEISSAADNHADDKNNPHDVTAAQVGLGNLTNDRQATKVEFDAHTADVSNPHSVTKGQVGLGNVNNTADMDKPISTATLASLGTKVDKATGKSLIPDTLIAKLEAIQAGAEVNVQSDWTQGDTSHDGYVKNKPTLGTAAALNTGTTAGTIPLIGAGNKIPLEIIPASAITDVQAFETIAARDAWTTAETGDIAIVTETSKSYVKSGATWLELKTPADLVTSVAGRTGNVVLTSADVAGVLTAVDILNVLNSTATNKALSAAQGKALNDSIVATAGNLNNLIGEYGIFAGATNAALGERVISDTVKEVRYFTDKFQYTTDGATWKDLTGPKGDAGRGYNPRGAWVSGGAYTYDDFTIDVVSYDGTSYYAKTTHSGVTTEPNIDAVNWGVLAQSGSLATGGTVLMTDYEKPSSSGSVSQLDTVNQAVGKLEKRMDESMYLGVFPTSGTGSAYTVNVPGLTELKNGMSITIIPHVVSTSRSATLNINGLGSKGITRRASGNSGASLAGASANWLSANYPITLVYNSSANAWTAESLTKPDATDLNGIVTIANGGLGADNAAGGRNNLGAAAKPVTADVTLLAANWTGSAAPYTYTLTLSGVTAPGTNESKQDWTFAIDPDDADVDELRAADIIDGGQAVDTVILKARGTKPTRDIPVRVTVQR